MGSHTRGNMSWTWAGFWHDDPVFRFNGSSFFQSGRNKAEERFWRKYIHDDGSYRTPSVRSRASSEMSSVSDSLSVSTLSSGSEDELVNLTRKSKEEEDEKKEESEDEKESKEIEKADSVSAFTCESCGHCRQAQEKERYISRIA